MHELYHRMSMTYSESIHIVLNRINIHSGQSESTQLSFYAYQSSLHSPFLQVVL